MSVTKLKTRREKVVVTRHSGLVEYLKELGYIDDNTKVIDHAKVSDVRGKHVIGVLPLYLAAYAWKVTEVPLALEPEDRGKDLPVERVRQIASKPVTYNVFTEEQFVKAVEMLERKKHGNGDINPFAPFNEAKENCGIVAQKFLNKINRR